MEPDNRATLRDSTLIERFVNDIPQPVLCILAHLSGMGGGRSNIISADVIQLILGAYPESPLNTELRELIKEKPVLLSAFAEFVTRRLEKAGDRINYIEKPCIVTVTDGGTTWELNLLFFLNALAAKNKYWADELGTLVVEKA